MRPTPASRTLNCPLKKEALAPVSLSDRSSPFSFSSLSGSVSGRCERSGCVQPNEHMVTAKADKSDLVPDLKAQDLCRLEELEARAQRLQMTEHGTLVLSSSSFGQSTAVAGDAFLISRQPSTTGEGGHLPTFAIPTLPPSIKIYTASSINLNPSSGRAAKTAFRLDPLRSNDPFSDERSVQTALSTDGLSFFSQATNVIPIVFASGASASSSSQTSDRASAGHSICLIGDAQFNRSSIDSAVSLVSSFSSVLWDPPTIERANVVHLSRPATASSLPQLSSNHPAAVDKALIAPHAGFFATPSVRSPLAQHTAGNSALLLPVCLPSPSIRARRNPFDDFPRPPNTPVTPRCQQSLGSPATTLGGSDRSVPSSPTSTAGEQKESFSVYSFGLERHPGPALTLLQQPARPPTLFRSGSVTRTGKYDHSAPLSNPQGVGPRDRSSAQTSYSAATFSVLGGFTFLLPTSPPA